MKILTVLFCLCLPLMGSDKKPLTKEESAKVIEAAIRKAAKKPTGELTKADLEKVTELNLRYKQITSVTGLEKLTQLKMLVLGYNQLTDVKGLEQLTHLEVLDLTLNKLTDVKLLEKLTKLVWLHLNNNELTDVTGLEQLTQLTYLHLGGNPDLTKAQIDELKKALPKCRLQWNRSLTKEESAKRIEAGIEAAIRRAAKKPTGELTKADLEKVTRLDLQSKKLTEVPKGLEKLTQLTILGLGSNKLTDVSGLEKLTQLTYLTLSNNELTNVTGLEKLTQLEGLNLNVNRLTDVKGLEKLTNLSKLHLQNNPDLTKAQIAELQKALPKCKISSNPTK